MRSRSSSARRSAASSRVRSASSARRSACRSASPAAPAATSHAISRAPRARAYASSMSCRETRVASGNAATMTTDAITVTVRCPARTAAYTANRKATTGTSNPAA